MKDYYQILNISRQATDTEIKKAYRKLVQLYHPDRNADVNAYDLIRDINEAYDVLGDPVKRSDYDYRLNNPYTIINEPTTPPHRDPAYRRQRPYRPPPPKEDLQRELMIKALRYANLLHWFGCFIVLLLMIDFSLPSNVYTEMISRIKVEQKTRRTTNEYIITNTGRALKITLTDTKGTFIGDSLLINESKLFSVVRKIESKKDNSLQITNLATIYRNFIFVPILLLIFSVLGLVVKHSVEFRFNVAFVNLIVLIFTLILLGN